MRKRYPTRPECSLCGGSDEPMYRLAEEDVILCAKCHQVYNSQRRQALNSKPSTTQR